MNLQPGAQTCSILSTVLVANVWISTYFVYSAGRLRVEGQRGAGEPVVVLVPVSV